jgi:Ribonuclease toxin, BrnT, of type II toxin-antitoxin system
MARRGRRRFALVRMASSVRRISVSSMSKDNFEWDDAKREDNLKRHRIDFHDVPALFDGPFLLRSSIRRGEHRLLAIGFIKWSGGDGRIYDQERQAAYHLGKTSTHL